MMLALLLGEAIIISAFILFRRDLPNNILALNIIVTSIIYCLFFIDIISPWIDLNDKASTKVGQLGVRWFFTWVYTILSILVMIISNVSYDLIFSTQLLIQGSVFFLLLLGVILGIQTSEKIKEVFIQESVNQNGIIEMKESIKMLKDRMIDFTDLPEYFITKINAFEENVRFISPVNSEEACELEKSFSETIHEISYAISNYSLNESAIKNNLLKCDRIYQKRKQLLFN